MVFSIFLRVSLGMRIVLASGRLVTGLVRFPSLNQLMKADRS